MSKHQRRNISRQELRNSCFTQISGSDYFRLLERMIEQHELCESNREMHFGLHAINNFSPGVHISYIRQNLRGPPEYGVILSLSAWFWGAWETWGNYASSTGIETQVFECKRRFDYFSWRHTF